MPYWFLILWFDKRNPAYYANGQNTTTNLHFPNHIARILRIITVRGGDENSFHVASLSIILSHSNIFQTKFQRWFHALRLVILSVLKSVLRIYRLRVTIFTPRNSFDPPPVIRFEIFIVNFYRRVFIDQYMGTIMRLIIFIEK